MIKHRFLLASLLLFVASYCVFLGYYWHSNSERVAFASIFSSDGASSARQPNGGNSMSSGIQVGSRKPSKTEAPAGAISDAVSPESTTPLAITDGPSSPTIKEMTTFAEQALADPDPDQRADSIVGMGNGTKMPNTIQALTAVITSDQVADNRALAVMALRTLSVQGDDDGTVRNALRVAAADSNARVAAMAAEALKDVERRLGS